MIRSSMVSSLPSTPTRNVHLINNNISNVNIYTQKYQPIKILHKWIYIFYIL